MCCLHCSNFSAYLCRSCSSNLQYIFVPRIDLFHWFFLQLFVFFYLFQLYWLCIVSQWLHTIFLFFINHSISGYPKWFSFSLMFVSCIIYKYWRWFGQSVVRTLGTSITLLKGSSRLSNETTFLLYVKTWSLKRLIHFPFGALI